MMYQCWDVHMWWRAESGALYESGVNTGWPAGTGSLEVLQDAAKMRGVDLGKCTRVSAEHVGEPYYLPEPK